MVKLARGSQLLIVVGFSSPKSKRDYHELPAVEKGQRYQISAGKTHKDPRYAWGGDLMTKLSLKTGDRALCYIY
ncbi:hypothetical protein [Salinivibrio kushneri]|uniref:hypothetical protein n=1 Tax=Salinivibrio kushneri TaxID=1908198 RepID=UPI00098955D2|nr:hypothetical protein [Salinivibrio kushneri]OOE63789.1 hypothetical protein BZG19_15740 [Salinivibrio kushneri]